MPDGNRGASGTGSGDPPGTADEVVEKALRPDDAFELLAHETRFRILEALAESGEGQSFSELRERVDVRDSGQFNYHLGKLVGRFVREDEGGYRLTVPGHRIVGAVRSGAYTGRLAGESVAVDAACPRCGAALVADFHDEYVTVACSDCEQQFTNPRVPAGALEGRTAAATPAVVDRWVKRQQWTFEHGFCPNCDGPVERDVIVPGDDPPEWIATDGDDPAVDAFVRVRCPRCNRGQTATVGLAVLTHPAVVAFHHEHGIDVRRRPVWDLPWLEPDLVSVTGREPLRVEVPIAIGDETLELVVDGDLQVVEERRRTATNG